MAKKRKKGASESRIIKFFPKTKAQMMKNFKSIKAKEGQIEKIKERIAGEKNPGNLIDFNVSLCQRKIELCNMKIRFFTFLSHQGEKVSMVFANGDCRRKVRETRAEVKNEKQKLKNWRERSKIRLKKNS